MNSTLLLTFSAGVLTFVLLRFCTGRAWLTPLADVPNERSLHLTPRLKVGGLAMWLTLGVLGPYWVPGLPMPLWLGALAIALVSLGDDLYNLPILVRLSCHAAAAAGLVVWLDPPGWTAWLAVPTVVWMANLYNFMDGADGLAGGMTLIGFGAMSLAAYAFPGGQGAGIGLACLLIACSAAGFLACNYPPASVFLGDAGSVTLGFLAAGLGLCGFVTGIWPYWFPALVFAPFIFDATYTLLRRMLTGQPWWKAHRVHVYQRLIMSGWSHRQLALIAYGIMLAASGLALAALFQETNRGIWIGMAAAGMTAALVAAERHLAECAATANN